MYKEYEVCVYIHFLAGRYPGVPAPFVEETTFAPFYCLCSFVKDQLTIFIGIYFGALCSVSPILHCLDYYSLQWVFREGNGTPLQYSCLENPMDRGAWWAAVHGVARSRTQLSDFTFTFLHWRRKWQPTPVFLLGESQGQGTLVGCRLWGRMESDTTEVT